MRSFFQSIRHDFHRAGPFSSVPRCRVLLELLDAQCLYLRVRSDAPFLPLQAFSPDCLYLVLQLGEGSGHCSMHLPRKPG